ncbi:MAG TPA: MRP family ATP-binding protein [Peptococcaceae bacterium]|nr:MAG: ATPases involved in chromosome partitioning [Clostridia bacterium 41_269]HBT20215.1 MRP family ATP-binding protein [Peptococcaceae bacterium]
MDLKEKIYKALEKVQDPELKKSLVELGMVEEVEAEGGSAKIKIVLTTKGCPLKNKIKSDVEQAVLEIEGIKEVEVIFGEMSPEMKKRIFFNLDMEKIAQVFKNTNVVLVGSGKGGVGKSTLTANFAFAAGKLGFNVGILDADFYGFSIPRLVGLEGLRVQGRNNKMIPLERNGVKVISVGSFIDNGDRPIIWRGPVIGGVLKQFILEVDWGNLDYLFVDLPPGTGDAPLSVMNMLPNSFLLVITTPQASASHIAGRIGFMAKEVNVKILGIVENMSFFTCPNCGKEYRIFGKGETEGMAKSLNAPILGRIPLVPEIREKSDDGNPVTLRGGQGQDVLNEITQVIIKRVEELKKK